MLWVASPLCSLVNTSEAPNSANHDQSELSVKSALIIVVYYEWMQATVLTVDAVSSAHQAEYNVDIRGAL